MKKRLLPAFVPLILMRVWLVASVTLKTMLCHVRLGMPFASWVSGIVPAYSAVTTMSSSSPSQRHQSNCTKMFCGSLNPRAWKFNAGAMIQPSADPVPILG